MYVRTPIKLSSEMSLTYITCQEMTLPAKSAVPDCKSAIPGSIPGGASFSQTVATRISKFQNASLTSTYVNLANHQLRCFRLNTVQSVSSWIIGLTNRSTNRRQTGAVCSGRFEHFRRGFRTVRRQPRQCIQRSPPVCQSRLFHTFIVLLYGGHRLVEKVQFH